MLLKWFRSSWGEFVLLVLGFLALFALLYFFVPEEKSKVPPLQFSLDLEKKFGEELEKEIKQDRAYYPDPTLQSSLNVILTRLTNGSEPLPYQVRVLVVKNPTVNAFTFPGGLMVIHTGLLSQASSAEEVAAVMAHELGHTAHRDTLKALVRQVGVSLVVAVVTGGQAAQLQEILSELIGLKFSRVQEAEADDFALKLLSKVKINPSHLASFFSKMNDPKTEDKTFLNFLQNHPDTASRLKKATEAAKQFKPQDAVPLPLNWQTVKSRLPTVF